MQFGAITIDTNIIKSNGYRFREGLLAQLNQFSGGDVRFVISEIVLEETKRHLIEVVSSDLEAIDKASNLAKKMLTLDLKTIANIAKNTENLPSSENEASCRIDRFIEDTNAIIIHPDQVKIRELTNLYFKPLPPFSNTARKKHEFPDAIALLSIEEWAKSTNQKVLAISMDKGWKEFADNSDWIEVKPDLATSLELFQTEIELAQTIVQTKIKYLDKNRDVFEGLEFEEKLQYILDDLALFAAAESDFDINTQEADLSYIEHNFSGHRNEYNFDILHIENDSISFKLELFVDIYAESEFEFYFHGKLVGEESFFEDFRIDFSLLVQLDGDVFADDNKMTISKIELLSSDNPLDFGYIEPDINEFEFIDP